MSTVCRIGVKYIAEKMDEQQQRLDQALTASVQANPTAVALPVAIGCFRYRYYPDLFRPVFLFAEKRKEICAATDKGALPV